MLFEFFSIMTVKLPNYDCQTPACRKIQKFATDVLGNLYIVKDNVLKLEFK